VLFNKNVGVVVTAIAVLAGLTIGVAGTGRAQDKAPDKDKPAAPVLNWKDNNEFVEADAANKETDAAKRLALLDKWKKDYPATDPAILIIRQDMFLFAYTQLTQARQAFDEAQEILKERPNLFPALIATVSQVMSIKPAPTAADMDTAEKVANRMLDNPDSVFADANKPANMTPAQWAQTRTETKPYAEKVLIAIYAARKDEKRQVDDLTKLIKKDPTLAVASYTLGQTMMKILGEEKKPEDQPTAFYQFARAVAYTGPGALAATDKTAIQAYLTKAYTGFHGSADGLTDLLAMAKANPFPPANFSIKSTVDIAKDEEAARQAEIAKDPLMYLWVHGVKEKLASDGDSYFDSNVKGFGLPPADDKTTPPTPQFFTAHIISMTPATKPKEILVGIEKADIADAKLTFETALPGKMDIGETIQFTGTAKDWSHDPKNIVVTFDVDPKDGLNGTWTGKNAPGAPRGGGRAGGAAKGTKAAPKQ
jgi:tetratricopeptide (TPR) repeat protein